MVRDALRTLLQALFRVLFSYECFGHEKIPDGAAIIAANHPSYLDPALLSVPVARPIRFMAWDAVFRVPFLGPLVRQFGAFPVDVRPGQGRSAYEAAKRLVEAGELVGIFPEGRRSRAGWLEPLLRAGAARLALETGAPLVPATIRGAFRAWPHSRKLPGFAKVQVRYHDPIDPASFHGLPESEAVDALLAELRRRVERTLMPGVKADARIEALYRSPAPRPRLFEWGSAVGLTLMVFWKARSFAAAWPCCAYLGYLLLDFVVIPQRRWTKRLRNCSAVLFTLAYLGWSLPLLGLPSIAGTGALLAVVAGAGFAYLYERGKTAVSFLRGLVAAALLELGALFLVPTPLGPQLALPLYAAVFAWVERTVFWRYSAPVLTAYALGVPLWLGGRGELPLHAVAALLAWVLVRLAPGGTATISNARATSGPTTTLGLRD